MENSGSDQPMHWTAGGAPDGSRAALERVAALTSDLARLQADVVRLGGIVTALGVQVGALDVAVDVLADRVAPHVGPAGGLAALDGGVRGHVWRALRRW